MSYEFQILATINAVVNIVMGILMAYFELKCYRRGIRIKLAYAFIGLSLAAFYAYILINPGYDAKVIGTTIVRPLWTVTLAILTIGAITRYKTCQPPPHL